MVYLLTILLRSILQDPLLGTVATVGARVVSSLLNFYMNKKLVFQAKVNTFTAMIRYYALAIPQLIVQSVLNQAVYTLFSIGSNQPGLRTIIHIVIMTILFIVSFTIQQCWVFAPQNSK